MAWVLDTDLITILQRRSQPAYDRLRVRLQSLPPEAVRVTAVNLQEQMRGWLAELNRARTAPSLLTAYDGLLATLRYYCTSGVLPFDRAAHDRFAELQKQGIRVATMDLR